MKVLVTNPPGRKFRRVYGDRWASSVGDGIGSGNTFVAFPFSLAYTAALLENKGHEVMFKDCVVEDMGRTEFRALVNDFSPGLIVCQTSTPSYYYDVETLKQIKGLAPVVAVGLHATHVPDDHLRDGCDYVIRGEHEYPTVKLVEYLEAGKLPEKKDGISYKEGDNIIISDIAQPVPDLNALPLPARHLMDMNVYHDSFGVGHQVWLTSTRGCAYNCTFCTVPIFSGRPVYRKRNPKLVVDEMEYVMEKYHPDEIYFDDASMTIHREHVTSICDELLHRGLKIRWRGVADANLPDEVLIRMAKAGCAGIKIGVESGSPEVLKAVNKPIKLDDAKRVVKLAHEFGMKVHGTYMFGIPGETAERAKESSDFMIELDTDTNQISIATPFPGTKFYKEAKEKGWLVTEDWNLYDGGHVVVSYPDYPKEEIERMFSYAVTRWERHKAFTDPWNVIHHFYNQYRQGGIGGVVRLGIWGVKRLIKGSQPLR